MRIGKNMPVSAEWYGISFGSNRFVAISNNSNIAAYMEKGQEWVQTTLPAIRKWQDIAFGNDTFIAVAKGTNKAAKSTDFGSTWTEITLADEMPWNDICFGDGKFVTIGGGQGDVCQHINYSSDNGDTWEMSELPCSDRWYKVCYGNNVFVALGNNSAAYSTDLVNWELTKMPADGAWRSVCYADGRFIALLSNTSIAAYSVDGITWLQTNLPSAKQWYSICYGNDRFFALSYESYAFSDDGIRWEEKGLDEYGYWYNICFGDGAFCSASNGSDNVLYSFDGSHVYYYAHGELSLHEKIKLAGLEEGGGGTATVVEDTLDSTSTTNALSANQGKVLNDELSNKVDKVEGKGLSTNDFTTEEKTKLAGIPEGGGATVVEDTLTSTSTTNALSANQGKILNEALDNKVDKVDGKGLSTEDFTTEEKTKLAGIPEGATATVVEDALTSTSATNALSANQGKVLNDTKVDKVIENPWETVMLINKGDFKSVCYGNNQFVAVKSKQSSDKLKISTSPDGITWTEQTVDSTFDSTNNVDVVCYANNQFVVAGGRTILTSPDGITWTTQTFDVQPAGAGLSAISAFCYGNGTYVLGCCYHTETGSLRNGSILTSPDGVTWTYRLALYEPIGDICYENNQFVAVATYGKACTSPDGVTWTQRTTGYTNNYFYGVCYGNNQYVAVGNEGKISTSPDGVTWTRQTSGTDKALTDVCYANNQYVAVGVGGTIITSTDGITWTEQSSGLPYNNLSTMNGICYESDKYVAVGASGTILTSSDGVAWELVNRSIFSIARGVCYANDQYVAVGDGGAIITSTNGTTWTEQSSGTVNQLNSICYGNSQYVAVGTSGTILTSPDGVTWTTQTSDTTNLLWGVCYGDGMYVAVGASGVLLTSSDGVSWTSRTSNVNFLFDVHYVNNKYVAVGTEGKITTSTNGVTWTARNVGVTTSLRDVCYGNGQYVIAGEKGVIMTSPDCVTWTAQTSSVDVQLHEICYADGMYVVHGLSGVQLTSPDGITWTTQTYGTTKTIWDTCYENGQHVGVGDQVIIKKEPDIDVVALLSGIPEGGESTVVEDTLDSTSTTNALSANQGKILNDTKCNSTFHDSGFFFNKHYNKDYQDTDEQPLVYFDNGPIPTGYYWGDGDMVLYSSSLKFDDVRVAFPQNQSITRIASGYGQNGMSEYVAISSRTAYFLPREQCQSWSLTKTFSKYIVDLCYDYTRGMYVIVGGEGTIYTSANGIEWTSRTSGVTDALTNVIGGNGTFIAYNRGNKHYILVSSDGIKWTKVEPIPTDRYMGPICYANGMFMMGYNTSGTNHILTSSDGITWTEKYDGDIDDIISIAGVDGQWLIGSFDKIYVSSDDGATWTEKPTLTTVNKLYATRQINWDTGEYETCYCSMQYDNIAGVSQNIDTWEYKNQHLRSATKGNDKYVAVGDFGGIATSFDGMSWEIQTPVTANNLLYICYGNGLYVAVGASGTIITSPDGVTWTAQTSGISNDLNSICYENSLYVAVGAEGTIITSFDGVTWTAQTSGTSSTLKDICYGNSQYVAVGPSGRVVTSTDGITWIVPNSLSLYDLNGVCYGNGSYVAVGESGTVYTSPDGVTWTKQTSGTYSDFNNICYGNNMFMSVSRNGYRTSIDGTNWKFISISNEYEHIDYLNGVCSKDDTFIVVGNNMLIGTMGKRNLSQVSQYLLNKTRKLTNY